jgi:hypothetical protein
MEIGIFGDSFCAYSDEGTWPDYLKKHYTGANITCFGKAGSSLFYSYYLMKQNYHKFDKIVFCATEASRLTLPFAYYKNHCGISTLSDAISQLSQNVGWMYSEEKENIAHSAKAYYTHLENVEFNEGIESFILDDIKRNFSDVLVIPCFQKNEKIFSLVQIYFKENGYFFNNSKTPQCEDRRKNHMIASNQKLLAQYMYDWLENNKSHITLDNFMKEPEDKSLYFSS